MLLLTRRRDQRGFRPGMSCPRQLIGGIIACETSDGRDAWIHRLSRLHPLRFNYFVRFKDVNGPALQFGHADWVPPGQTHVDR